MRNVAISLAVAMIAASAATDGVHAQTFPAKPIRMIVAYPPGGGVDLTARLIAPGLHEALGQPVIVENRTGANGNIGSEAVVRAAADGHTLLMGYNGNLVIMPALSTRMPFDSVRDLTPVALTVVSTNLLVAHPSLPVRSVQDLVAFAKSRPGQINYASSGIGSVGHMAAELFAMTAGVKLQHIPYKGNGQAISEVLVGQVPLMFSAPAAVISHVRASKLRPLAVASNRRPPGLEAIPTFGEVGYAGVEASAWFGVFGPAGLPPSVVERLNAEIVRILNRGCQRQAHPAGLRSRTVDTCGARPIGEGGSRQVDEGGSGGGNEAGVIATSNRKRSAAPIAVAARAFYAMIASIRAR